MTARFIRPVSVAASSSRRLGLFCFLLAATSLLLQRLGVLKLPDLIPVILIAGLIAVIALLLAMIGLVRLWQKGSKGGWASLVGLLLSLATLAPVGYGGWLWESAPPVYDISTDLADPPSWIEPPHAAPTWMARPPVDASERLRQLAAYPEVATHNYVGGLDRVMKAVRTVSKALHLKIVATTGLPEEAPAAPPVSSSDATTPLPLSVRAPGTVPVPSARPDTPAPTPIVPDMAPTKPAVVTIQAVHRSLVFGLSSDVLIRLREQRQSTLVDIRVVARYGDRDFGTGSTVIDDFYDRLETELQTTDG